MYFTYFLLDLFSSQHMFTTTLTVLYRYFHDFCEMKTKICSC